MCVTPCYRKSNVFYVRSIVYTHMCAVVTHFCFALSLYAFIKSIQSSRKKTQNIESEWFLFGSQLSIEWPFISITINTAYHTRSIIYYVTAFIFFFFTKWIISMTKGWKKIDEPNQTKPNKHTLPCKESSANLACVYECVYGYVCVCVRVISEKVSTQIFNYYDFQFQFFPQPQASLHMYVCMFAPLSLHKYYGAY